jgi:prepilin-type N-terminal cleavage/methylation domain-containing protein
MTLRNRPVRDGAATAGFTLIEVTVVLVILGLALAQLAQRGPLRSAALDLRAATVTVVQGLRLARARAILADRAVVLAVDAARQTVRVGDDRPLSPMTQRRRPARPDFALTRTAAQAADGSTLQPARGAPASPWTG